MKKDAKLVLVILITATILGGLSFSKTVTASHSEENRSTSWTGTRHTERISDDVDEPWLIDDESTSFPQLLTINCEWQTVYFGYVILAGTYVDRVYNIVIDITIIVPSGSNYTETIDRTGYSIYDTGIWHNLGSVTFNLTQADIQEGGSDEIEVYYKYKYTEGIEGYIFDYTWSSDLIYMYSIKIGEDWNIMLTIIALMVIGAIAVIIASALIKKKPTKEEAKITEKLAGPTPKKLYCSNCRAKLTPGSRFCTKCGASVD